MNLTCFEDVCKIEDLTTYPFHVEARYEPSGDRTHMILKTLLKPRELRPHDHPYMLPPDCIHYVLWSKRDMTKEQVDKYLKSRLKNREYVAFTNMNQENNQIELFHVHVICKSL
jgi:hypothetical protein